MKEILIIEPSSALNLLLRKILSKDYKVYGHTTSNDIKNIDHSNIDILITEIFFNNGVTGWELIEHFNNNYPNVDVIIISSVYTDDIMNKAFSYNIKDFIKKPLSTIELKHRIGLD